MAEEDQIFALDHQISSYEMDQMLNAMIDDVDQWMMVVVGQKMDDVCYSLSDY